MTKGITKGIGEPKYAIASSEYRCARCETEIPCETAYYSVVTWSADAEGFRRQDLCKECWRQSAKEAGGPARPSVSGAGSERDPGAPEAAAPTADRVESLPARVAGEEVFAFWRTRRPPEQTQSPRRVRFDPELIFGFFLRLGDLDLGDLDLRDDVELGASATEAEAAKRPETPPRETTPAAVAARDSGADDAESAVAPDRDGSPEDPLDTETVEVAEAFGDGAFGEEGILEEPPASLASPEGVPAAERDELRFFLSLLLIRKKILQFKSSMVRDGREWLILTDRRQPGRIHRVVNPNANEERLQKLKDRIGELLQMRI